jgi:hypothetical protein
LKWWGNIASEIHDVSVLHSLCIVEDPNDWLAWQPFLDDLGNGDIHLKEMNVENTEMVIERKTVQNSDLENVPTFTFDAAKLFPNLYYDVVNELSVSLLDNLYPFSPQSGPIQGKEDTCQLILENVFGIDIKILPPLQVVSFIKHRLSAVPDIIVDFVEKNIGYSIQDEQIDANDGFPVPPQFFIEPKDERWNSLRTYLEDAEVVGNLIHLAWLGNDDARGKLGIIQEKFIAALDQRPQLGRTVRTWPTSVELVAKRLMVGWSRPDDVRALLVVLDCCSLPMGSILIDEMRRAGITPSQTKATLAREPTLTSISRKALAAGKHSTTEKDDDFGPIHSTYPETRLWRSLWQSKYGLSVQTHRVVNAERKPDHIRNLIKSPSSTSLFVVFNELDHLVHASSDLISLTHEDMTNIARRWMVDTLIPFLQEAIQLGWRIAITSDHGCTQVVQTITELEERTLSEAARSPDIREMGERVIWPRPNQAEKLKSEVDGRLIYVAGHPCILLPPGQVSSKGTAFGFAHGGISLEEVVVPYFELGAW